MSSKIRNSNLWLPLLILMALAGCNNTEETYMVGTLERDRIEVRVESDEPIIAIHVQDGQMLTTGDLILEQDPARLKNMLAQQVALKDQAAARLAELQRGPRQETIREARALLASTQASTVNSLANMKRTKEMFNRDLSNQFNLDLATTRWKTATAAEQAATESLDRLQNGTTVEELQQAEAAYAAARARVAQVELDLSRLKIYAPVDGMLDKRLYLLGERPQRGTTIAVILDAARIYARIYVPEPLRSSMQPGKQLDVRIDGQSRLYTGTVSWVSADATFTPYFALTEHDRSRLSFLAEVDIPDASGLPSGVPLEVDFPVTATTAD